MEITVGRQFFDDLRDFEILLKKWDSQSRQRVFRAYRRVGVAWKAEAQKRIPIKTGMARQHVVTNTSWDGDHEIFTETGSNLVDPETGIPYPIYIEFGTKWIAKGRVKALGYDPFVTDAQAVKNWPAKDAEALTEGNAVGAKLDKNGKLRDSKGRFIGGPGEQMPWLRPAFNFIRDWAIREIEQSFVPPK